MMDLSERFAVMLEQESFYFRSHPTQKKEWRNIICEWSCKVVDFHKMNWETVTVSLSYIDRYLATHVVDKWLFQLVGLTSLYLAVKLYERRKLDISSFVVLSRGSFSVDDVLLMEKELLWALDFRMHPPTPQTMVRHLMFLLPPKCITPTVKFDIIRTSLYLIELSMLDYFFVTYKPSTIALASFLVAMDIVDVFRLPLSTKKLFLEKVRQVTDLEADSSEVNECRARLHEAHQESTDDDQDAPEYQNELDTNVIRHEIVSPVSVSGFVDTASYVQQQTSRHCTKRDHSDIATHHSEKDNRSLETASKLTKIGDVSSH